jgi:DNA repair protein RecO (recombination protein O)
MNKYATEGIILARINYGEADRILTFLTPDHGKVKAFAKGVRKQKSKLAGGLELFSVCSLSIMVGKSEINTLISTRLKKHYGEIVKNLDRTNAGYDMIKLINQSTAEHPEPAYFELLRGGFEGLDDSDLDWRLSKLWFDMHLLQLTGHAPNLKTDANGKSLEKDTNYNFDIEAMCFVKPVRGEGVYTTNHIKLLRLAVSASVPKPLAQCLGFDSIVNELGKYTGLALNSVLQLHYRG